MPCSSGAGIRNCCGEKSPTVRSSTGRPLSRNARTSPAIRRISEPTSVVAMRPRPWLGAAEGSSSRGRLVVVAIRLVPAGPTTIRARRAHRRPLRQLLRAAAARHLLEHFAELADLLAVARPVAGALGGE